MYLIKQFSDVFVFLTSFSSFQVIYFHFPYYMAKNATTCVGWVAQWLVHSTFKRDIVGSNPARVETIFRLLVRLDHDVPWVEYKVDRAALGAVLGDRQRHRVHGGSMKSRLYKYMYITIAAASMCLRCLVA